MGKRNRQPVRPVQRRSALSVATGVGLVILAVAGLTVITLPPSSRATTTTSAETPRKVYAGLSGTARIETPDGTIQMPFPAGSKIYFEDLENDGKPANPAHMVITITDMAPFRALPE